ncbi:MAG TPA: XRE family transcriptional regulator [Candidatus Galloscillospira excrementavium]|nr:XRE family transcriptional regulator [Candidatus Galloscillospira excrementavium]
MEKRRGSISREDILRRMDRLARAKVNDGVKLAFLDEMPLEEIQKLNLTALAEFKRSGTGTVEVKFIDRMQVLERMADLVGEQQDSAEGLFLALEQTAETEGTREGQAVLEKTETGSELVV